jgi:hypothetical protein
MDRENLAEELAKVKNLADPNLTHALAQLKNFSEQDARAIKELLEEIEIKDEEIAKLRLRISILCRENAILRDAIRIVKADTPDYRLRESHE